MNVFHAAGTGIWLGYDMIVVADTDERAKELVKAKLDELVINSTDANINIKQIANITGKEEAVFVIDDGDY